MLAAHNVSTLGGVLETGLLLVRCPNRRKGTPTGGL